MSLSGALVRPLLTRRLWNGPTALAAIACLSRTVVDFCQAANVSAGRAAKVPDTCSPAPTFQSVFLTGQCSCIYKTKTQDYSTDINNNNGNNNKAKRTEVTYDQLIALINSGDIQLFDVREPQELQQTGTMPHAVNLPLGNVGKALQMSEEEFKEVFGIPKPKHTDTNIVFSCLAGFRSKCALDAATDIGYTSARHYPGGWEEWEQLNGPVSRVQEN